MKKLRLQFNRLCLQFDRDYGIDRRTGWTAVFDGCVYANLTTFGRAFRALVQAYLSHRGLDRA